VAAEAITGALDGGDFGFGAYARALRRATVGRELAIDRWLAWLLYRVSWRQALSLVMCDERMLEVYAARVSGTMVLADHKRELVFALWRHLFRARTRRNTLDAAEKQIPQGDQEIKRTEIHRTENSQNSSQEVQKIKSSHFLTFDLLIFL